MLNPKQIYFDYNATAPCLTPVKEAMFDIMSNPLNPSSLHTYGRNSRSIIDTARSRISQLLGASDDYQVIFTSTGTESNNTALLGMRGYKLLTSEVEHQSVLKVVGKGEITVDKNGIVEMDVLEHLLATANQPVLVSIQFANSETGVIQPIADITKLVHKYNGLMHTDAAQAFGRIPFSVSEYDIDLLTITGHKFGGPVGASALILKKNLPLQPLMQGGGQEMRFRSGTQNVVAIHGFGMAAEIVASTMNNFAYVGEIRDYIEEEIIKIAPEVTVFGKNAPRLPNTSSISMPGISNETQVIYFDINGIAVSSGSACSSGRVDLPYVQMAMGYSEEVARTSLRISLGINNTIVEAKEFIVLWKQLYLKSNELIKAA